MERGQRVVLDSLRSYTFLGRFQVVFKVVRGHAAPGLQSSGDTMLELQGLCLLYLDKL